MLYTPLKREAHAGTALNFHDVRGNIGTRYAASFSSSMRLLRRYNAEPLRSVRGIRDVFMSKHERPRDLEPAMPSPALATSCFPPRNPCFPHCIPQPTEASSISPSSRLYPATRSTRTVLHAFEFQSPSQAFLQFRVCSRKQAYFLEPLCETSDYTWGPCFYDYGRE